jgi:hypothetical protein
MTTKADPWFDRRSAEYHSFESLDDFRTRLPRFAEVLDALAARSGENIAAITGHSAILLSNMHSVAMTMHEALGMPSHVARVMVRSIYHYVIFAADVDRHELLTAVQALTNDGTDILKEVRT